MSFKIAKSYLEALDLKLTCKCLLNLLVKELCTCKEEDNLPDVSLWPGVLLALKQLRRGVRGTSAPRRERAGVGKVIAEAEIRQLDVHVRVEQKVFCFEVPMDNTVRVAVVDS